MIPTIEEQLNGAIEYLKTQKNMLICAAVKAYSVDQITLTCQLCGSCSLQELQKEQLLLSTEQEQLLIK